MDLRFLLISTKSKLVRRNILSLKSISPASAYHTPSRKTPFQEAPSANLQSCPPSMEQIYRYYKNHSHWHPDPDTKIILRIFKRIAQNQTSYKHKISSLIGENRNIYTVESARIKFAKNHLDTIVKSISGQSLNSFSIKSQETIKLYFRKIIDLLLLGLGG